MSNYYIKGDKPSITFILVNLGMLVAFVPVALFVVGSLKTYNIIKEVIKNE